MLIIVHGVSGNSRSFGQVPLQNITCIVYLILGHPQSKHTKSCEGPEIITKPITFIIIIINNQDTPFSVTVLLKSMQQLLGKH